MKKVYRIIETTGEWEDEYSRTVACYFSEYRANTHLDELKDTYNNADQIRAKNKCQYCPLHCCDWLNCDNIECDTKECIPIRIELAKGNCELADISPDGKCKNYAELHDNKKYSMETLEVIE